MKKDVSVLLLLLPLTLAAFIWSVLTENTAVRLTARDGLLSLDLNGRRAGECPIPRYRNAQLSLLAPRSRQWGQNFCQGWRSVTVRSGDHATILFSNIFPRGLASNWHPITGTWGLDLWGRYSLRNSISAEHGYGETRLEGISLENFIYEEVISNLSDAGIGLRLDHGDTISIRMIIVPDLVVNWYLNGRCIKSISGEDLTQPSAEQLAIWPSTKKIIKNLLAKICGSVLVGQLLVVAMILYCLILRLCFPPRASRLLHANPPSPHTLVKMAGRWPFMSLALIFLLSLAATSYISYYVYYHMPHIEDEVSQCFQAKIFSSGHLWCPQPLHPEFFKKIDSLIFYHGRVFSQYPYAHSAMLALGYLTGLPWLIPPLISSLSLVIIVRIYRELYGPRGWPLVFILCISSPFFLFLAGSYMNHTTCLFFISLFILFIVKARNQNRMRHYALAAFSLGLAFCTRPITAIAVSTPFIIMLLVNTIRGTARHTAFLILFFMVLAIVASSLMLYNYLLIGSFTNSFSTIHEKELQIEKVRHDHYRVLGFGKDVGAFGGHSPRRALFNTNVNLSNLMVRLYGWPVFFTLAFIFIPFITARSNRVDWLCLTGVISLPLGYFFYFHYGYSFGPRYWFESLPFLLILTVRGIYELASLDTIDRIRPLYSRLCVYALVGILIFINLSSWIPSLPQKVPYSYFYFSFRPIFRDLIKEMNIHNAVIFVRQRDIDNYDFMTAFELNSPDLRGDVVIARDLGPEKNRLLMKEYPGRKYYIGDWTEKVLCQINPD